jgi:hypothetical protein
VAVVPVHQQGCCKEQQQGHFAKCIATIGLSLCEDCVLGWRLLQACNLSGYSTAVSYCTPVSGSRVEG